MARDLRLFYLFRLLATSYLWVPIFIPFKQSRGLSFLEIMILGGIYSAVVIVCEIPTGAFADRIGRRTSMMAGALTMALSCLIAYGSHGMAGFAVSEARFGILPAVIGPYVVNAVGKRQARRLALTATRIGAAEALAIGLVQQVAAVDALDAAVDATVAELLTGGPQAQREIKQLFAQLAEAPVTPEGVELTAQTISRVRGSDEAREGFAAFLAKRPAAWMPQ